MNVKLTRHELEELLTGHLRGAFPGFRICDDGVSVSSYDGSASIELERVEERPVEPTREVYIDPPPPAPSSPPPSTDYRPAHKDDDIPF